MSRFLFSIILTILIYINGSYTMEVDDQIEVINEAFRVKYPFKKSDFSELKKDSYSQLNLFESAEYLINENTLKGESFDRLREFIAFDCNRKDKDSHLGYIMTKSQRSITDSKELKFLKKLKPFNSEKFELSKAVSSLLHRQVYINLKDIFKVTSKEKLDLIEEYFWVLLDYGEGALSVKF